MNCMDVTFLYKLSANALGQFQELWSTLNLRRIIAWTLESTERILLEKLGSTIFPGVRRVRE